MKTDFVFLADSAQAVDGKLFVLGGGITHVTAPMLPWAQTVAVCVRLSPETDDEDLEDGPLDMELSVFGPFEQIVMGPLRTTAIPQNAPPTPGDDRAHILALTINGLLLSSYGPHRMALTIGGCDMELSFRVVPSAAM